MKTRNAATLGLILAAALTLTACSSGADDTTAPATPDPYATFTPSQTPASDSTATAAPAAEGAALMTADSSLGTIVVDGSGMTVYMYDSDTQGSGTSTCTGGCLSAWPPVPGGSDAPTLTGITGDVTTITGTDGNPQLALNGWPLYYYASDSAAGDTMGQGVGGVWWVLDAAGEPVHS
ncbi:MAG: hypothetical protein NVV57_01615 [Demequina sp.]|jgi:predicted lipoprotein with Yx(FWY)xxD motif|nr:hypothetical protein [Demequina sp.]